MSSSIWIDGSATFTIATSRIVMKKAVPTTASVSHFRRWMSVIRCSLASRRERLFAGQRPPPPNLFHRRPRRKVPRPALVAEVAPPREHHRAACAVDRLDDLGVAPRPSRLHDRRHATRQRELGTVREGEEGVGGEQDRKSTRLNSSHVAISYAVFCLKKKT